MNKKLGFWLLEQNKKYIKAQAQVFSHGSCTQNDSRDVSKEKVQSCLKPHLKTF